MAKDYPNRSDLRGGKMPKMAATGQTYGEAGKQMAAQAAVPMAPSPTEPAITAPLPPVQMPGQITDLTGPTNRPNEPLTAGMNFGPGPGSEVFGAIPRPAPGSNADLAERVRAVASLYPNPALLQLLMDLQQ
jgi:hypothetical protein